MTEDNKQDTSFPSGGSRTEYIGAKVTVEQKQYIRRLAAECGMTVSSYVLARAFNYRPKARLTARQEAVMETLIGCRSDLVNYTSALRGMNPESADRCLTVTLSCSNAQGTRQAGRACHGRARQGTVSNRLPTGQGTVKTGRTSHDRESEIHLPRDK